MFFLDHSPPLKFSPGIVSNARESNIFPHSFPSPDPSISYRHTISHSISRRNRCFRNRLLEPCRDVLCHPPSVVCFYYFTDLVAKKSSMIGFFCAMFSALATFFFALKSAHAQGGLHRSTRKSCGSCGRSCAGRSSRCCAAPRAVGPREEGVGCGRSPCGAHCPPALPFEAAEVDAEANRHGCGHPCRHSWSAQMLSYA